MLTGLHSGYLTSRQLDIWKMLQRGLSQSEIARRLSVSRQAVNKLADTIPERISSALNDAAKLNRVDPKYMDVSKGVLVGYSRDLQTEVVVAMGPRGLQVWYQHNLGRCDMCPDEIGCKSILLRNAKELGVSLTPGERKLEPSRLSNMIFSRLLGRDNK